MNIILMILTLVIMHKIVLIKIMVEFVIGPPTHDRILKISWYIVKENAL